MKAHSPNSPRSRFRLGRWVAVSLLAYVFFTAIKAAILIRHSLQLGKRSDAFQRDYHVGDPTSPEVTYLVMGDSTAAGWGAKKLGETYPFLIAKSVAQRGFYVHVINIAVGGARLEDMERDQLSALSRAKPDLISVSIGANDTTHFTSPAIYSRKLKNVLSKLEASGARTILFANTPEMYLAPALPLPLSLATNSRARQQNVILQETLKGSKIRQVNLYDEGRLDYGVDQGFYAADLFHPSGKGYRVWADVFIRSLKNAPISSHIS